MTNQLKNSTSLYSAYSADQQTKAIKSITSRGKMLRKDVIALANGFLLKYDEDGDYTKIMQIADAIGAAYTQGTRKAFLDWVQVFTKTLRWNEADKTMSHIKRKNAGNGQRIKLHTYTKGEDTITVTHEEMSFFELIQEKTTPVKLIERLTSLLKTANKGIEKGTNEGYTAKEVEALTVFAIEQGWVKADA